MDSTPEADNTRKALTYTSAGMLLSVVIGGIFAAVWRFVRNRRKATNK